MSILRYLVILVGSLAFAMPNLEGSMGLIRSISADNGTAGTFQLGWYLRGFQEQRIADMTGDSIGNYWAGTQATYGGGDLGLYLGYAPTDWFSFNVASSFHADGIDYDETGANRASVGFGDTKIGLKFGLGRSLFRYGLYTFVSLPTGSDREIHEPLETAKYPFYNAAYTNPGGLFRYFSSNATDYGAIGLLTLKSGIMNLDLNLGYVLKNGADGGLRDNYSVYNAALSFNTGPVSPFVELSGIDYSGKNKFFTFGDDSLFGPNPVYITPGLSFQPGNFNINLAMDIRAWEGENKRDFPTAVTDSFNVTTGWGTAPPWAIIFGVSYSKDFIPEKPKTGIIAGTVTNNKTKQPLTANVGIYKESTLLESKVSGIDGTFEFAKLEPDIYKLLVGATDFTTFEIELLVKPNETTPVTIALEPIVKEGLLILNILDMESRQSMTANVIIGDMPPEKTTGKFEKSLLAGTYTLRVIADAENYIPHERSIMIEAGKTLEIEIPLVKKEFKIVLPQVYFETGKSEIKPESYPVLDDAVKTIQTVLSGNPDIKIEIQGHTDSIGSDSYNLTLSQDRATSVMNYLVTRHGIAINRLIAKGYGETQPIASNKSLEGRSKNRRVEFVIIK